MKIAIFSDAFPPQVSGVANVVYTSAKELTRLGHEVDIITVSDHLISGKKIRNINGINLIEIPSMPSFVYPKTRLAIPSSITFNYIRKHRPDIIHTHTPFSIGWEAIEVAKLFKIPVTGTHHTFFDHYLKYTKLNNRFGKKFSWKYTVSYYNLCDLIISPSHALAKELKLHGLKKPIEIVPNSIDIDLFRPILCEDDKEKLKRAIGINCFGVCYMGRLSYEKSVDQVLRAVAIAKQNIPDLHLTLIGDGPERKKLERLAKELKIDHNTIFTGFLHDQELVEALQANDVFLTASKTENMPLSVLEAMACGLPEIVADTLGLSEIISNNANGFLVKPDDINEMAEKIILLSNKKKLLSSFSAESRKMSLNYSFEKNAKALEKIYLNLIDNNKRRKRKRSTLPANPPAA